ncbi:tyrosine-type recombinase/integrase [Candidatus Vondammii sp. HM_W22]|uniref:tyrosine-type recombinase/integrase n=1 Tax=Candidatus Vondammii sp. HM_W22 TaxID=2687299 RepID=UPI001F136999|nr:site-specific integrase [Candidatus Vondammii sp. HM_W22]
MENQEIAPEMRLFSPTGERLYLNAQERAAFLSALDEEEPNDRMFCQLLHYTGCRPTEALQLVPARVLIEEQAIVYRSLKKRKVDGRGRKKLAQYRAVPVPAILIEYLDLVFDLRARKKRGKDLEQPLWSMSRPTAYRLVKRVMRHAGVTGKQATGKGLRHAFGVAMVTGEKPLPLHILAQIMGHSDTKTTEIYLQVVGDEKHKLVMEAWSDQREH